jgi:uncharacterized protein YqjF (DUF2071 family)
VGAGDLLQSAKRQGSTLSDVSQRPWPLPESPWLIGQTLVDQLFVHHRVPTEQLRGLVPDELEIQEHSGSAWIGVTPFAVTGLRARGLLALPFVSSSFGLNVRTFVTRDDRPGIWFLSLDSSSRLAVEAARRIYRLPYFSARISLVRAGGRIAYECSRHEGKAFSGTYTPDGDVFDAAPGSLEHFLVERYCFYAEHGGKLYSADIHHAPWPLQPARAEIDLNTMPPADLDIADDDPVLHYSARQDVVIWPLHDT